MPKGTENVQKGHGSEYDVRGTSEATDVNGVEHQHDQAQRFSPTFGLANECAKFPASPCGST